MSKFFVATENIFCEEEGTRIIITGTDVRHIKDVLRYEKGSEIELCDSHGREFLCKITKMDDKTIETEVVSETMSDTEPRIPVVLIQGVPKGEKAEFIVQKCVELGVNEILFAETERTVVKFKNDSDREKKQERWQRVSMEAAKQSGRGAIPKVGTPQKLKNIISEFSKNHDNWLKIIPYENEMENSLKSVMQQALEGGKTLEGIVFCIGPEGGFGKEEVELCQNNGFVSVTLGKRILRTETAGLSVLAAIRYEIGD